MYDATPCREPLNIARSEPRRRSKRIGMVDETLTHDGHRLEPTMRMLRKAGNRLPVIHPPTVLAFKILANVPAGEQSSWP